MYTRGYKTLTNVSMYRGGNKFTVLKMRPDEGRVAGQAQF